MVGTPTSPHTQALAARQTMNITFKSERFILSIDSSESEQYDQLEWIDAIISVEAECFRGNFSCNLYLEDIPDLLKKLKDLEHSIGKELEIQWGNIEDNLMLTFHMKATGQIECSYEVSPYSIAEGPTLHGSFETDQSYLPNWISQLKKFAP